MEYGPRYDTALKELMWELLSCLERLFPVPDFKKVLSFLQEFEPKTNCVMCVCGVFVLCGWCDADQQHGVNCVCVCVV